MKLVLTAAAFVCALPAAALAQTAPNAVPAPAATPAPAAAPATAAKFNLDTPIEELVANADAKAVLAANGLGEVDQHPAYEQFKGMSLRAVQPFSDGKVTDEMLAKIEAGLAKIK